MKKTYIQPETVVVKLDSQALLNSVSYNRNDYINSNDDLGGNERNRAKGYVWDDEDDWDE